jgi:hypothetical protein
MQAGSSYRHWMRCWTSSKASLAEARSRLRLPLTPTLSPQPSDAQWMAHRRRMAEGSGEREFAPANVETEARILLYSIYREQDSHSMIEAKRFDQK